MKRRNFLKYAAAGTAVPHFIPYSGAGKVSSSPWVRLLEQSLIETDHVMVLIRLDGGNDGLNTVIPLDQFDKLNNVRPHVIMPESSLLGLDGQDKIAFHPAMTGLRNLYNEGQLKIIQSVGYPNQDFSHFRSSDIWMTGADHDQVLGTGWAGRYLENEFPNFPVDYPNEQMPDPLSMEIGPRLSLTFQGSGTAMGMSVYNPDDFYRLVDGIQTPVPETPAGELLEHIRLVKQQSNSYGERVSEAYLLSRNRANYPQGNELAEQLAIVARLISGGLKTRIYLVSISGFDTHDNQVTGADHTVGEHANLLRSVSDAVEAFMKDIKLLNLEERVVGMTFSEFGRRIVSNASLGTDHGAAAPMFVFGKPVEGGVIGENPFIPTNATYEDNIEMQYDFRALYATMLKDWFCLEDSDLSNVMLDQYETLPIINGGCSTTTSTRDRNRSAGTNLLTISPNPTRDWAVFEFENEDYAMLQIFDMQGQLIATPVNRKLPKGKQQIRYNFANLPSGMYSIRLHLGDRVQTKQVVKR
ncbi:MAG: DUF1501 domain-containing protein [Bacteroidota bacterium]